MAVRSLEGHLWLPFTQMGAFDSSERTFLRARDRTLFDTRGRSVFDAISSVWTIIHGHCHPKITEAISRQAATLDHVTALGASNPVAEKLAERLADLSGLPWSFFASDGASAIEAALKISLQYWRNVGRPERNRFVHLVSSYHGDTIGAMSVSDITLFRKNFDSVCFETVAYEELGAALARPDVAAVIVEPQVQAAAGMRLVPPEVYELLKGSLDPLLIVDEIATGFGRTGTMFAFHALGLRPDLLCLGKGITGGGLALSATLATDRVFAAFTSEYTSDYRHLFHGHSYAANPIACAAALASLEIFESAGTLDAARALATHLAGRLASLRSHAGVVGTRQAGLMCGIEVANEAGDDAAKISRGWRIANAMYDRGHFTRPIGNVVQLVPPLSTTPSELDAFLDVFADLVP